ncbi:hypothetical protein HPNQ4228_0471 [Helicobacter pylori NQ4228]|nr:hypothetical protein HPNQ4228_0471 [Helicobacter pylori NQ4228]
MKPFEKHNQTHIYPIAQKHAKMFLFYRTFKPKTHFKLT